MPSFPFEVTTSFLPINIPARATTQGMPIGQGKCVAVYLYLNSLVLNTQAAAQTAANEAQIYYGDEKTQLIELVRGQFSKLIYVDDLSKIYVRCNGVANTDNLVAMVYTRSE
jgi:hypothetical protein